MYSLRKTDPVRTGKKDCGSERSVNIRACCHYTTPDKSSGGNRTRVARPRAIYESTSRPRHNLLFTGRIELPAGGSEPPVLPLHHANTQLPPGFDPGMPDAESNVITDFTTEAERLLGIEPSLARTQHAVLPLTLQPQALEL